MFFLFVSFFPFALLLSKSLPFQPLPPWANEMRLVSVLCFQELLFFLAHLFQSCRPAGARPTNSSPPPMSPRKRCAAAGVENAEALEELSILDLPELTLECILEKLTPAGLCNMAAVCSSLRERCCSDHLWEKHMRERWGRVIGHAARRDWKLHLTSAKDSAADLASKNEKKNWIDVLSCLWPASLLTLRIDSGKKVSSPLLDDSIICWYRSLESGKVWFPAQVYNREHGHVGFMLSCYDAEVCYDSGTDTFHARYPPHGRRTIVLEEGVQWCRLRAPPVETPAHALHISNCLSDLHPGNHFEIQWRRNKEFPYGWWYGVIGHLESCDGNQHFCRCHLSDTIILEFRQYTAGSRWRRMSIDRKYHSEEGNEADGFYGGIRKLQSKDDIAKWTQLWPADVLE